MEKSSNLCRLFIISTHLFCVIDMVIDKKSKVRYRYLLISLKDIVKSIQSRRKYKNEKNFIFNETWTNFV